jgi:PAS domain-containing protein
MRLPLIIIALLIVIAPAPALAFEQNYLLSDSALTNVSTMSLADVQQFLQSRSSTLASRFLPDSSGLAKLPAEIVWYAAREATINPQVLLTMLQKEQSLVDDQSPTQRQLDAAMGYGCPDGNGCSPRFKGFGKQVRGAALQLRGYLGDLSEKGQTIAQWAVGRSRSTGDGYTIVPRNAATAALYSYTPWRGSSSGVGGNFSFVRIFTEWFGGIGSAYPDGATLRGPDGRVWFIQNGQRHHLTSLGVLRSRSSDAKVIGVSSGTISAYPEAAPIRFTNYAIVEDNQGVRWLLDDSTKRRFASSEVLRQIGYHPDEIERATDQDLSAYREGDIVEALADAAQGVIIQDLSTGGYYLEAAGTKRPILHETILAARYPGQSIRPRLRDHVEQLGIGAPITFPDGELVTAPGSLPQVFVISQGKRRPFVSPRVIEQLGYSWSNLRVTSNEALALHELGDVLSGDGGAVSAPETVAAPSQPTAPLPPTHSYAQDSGLSLF